MELNEQPIGLKKLVLKKLATPSVSALLLIGIFLLYTFEFQMSWIGTPFQSDVDQYYSYLVAKFIYQDLSFHFPHHYWLIEAPTGALVPKVTMGMALLYLPFFVIGNNIAYLHGYDGLGYSEPFGWSVHFGTLVYVLIGFWYMRKTLLIFFSEWVSAISIFLVFFATNLFYYTFKEGEMSHSYLFFLFSLFFYHSVKWHFTRRFRYLCYISFIAGFVSLIRPTEVVILLIPLFYQVTSGAELLAKFKELFALRWKWLILAGLFLLPLLPQLLFWKYYTGQFLFFSYGSNEGFFFGDPKIYSVLFGGHKGWFLYTPLVFLMTAGLILMWFRWKRMALPITLYLLLNIYLVSSWWDWGFGGAYGMRALVQTYAFLAVPLAFFLKAVFTIPKLKFRVPAMIASLLVSGLFISINFFHMWQHRGYVFHWDAMTKKAYWYTLFKTHYTEADRAYLETLLQHPDYEAMRKGDRDEK